MAAALLLVADNSILDRYYGQVPNIVYLPNGDTVHAASIGWSNGTYKIIEMILGSPLPNEYYTLESMTEQLQTDGQGVETLVQTNNWVTRDLTTIKNELSTQIDVVAEQKRLTFLTPGSGQAMEYDQTAKEAATAATLPDPLTEADFPFLKAELDAQIGAGTSPTPTLRDIVNQVQAQATAWYAPGAAIKQTRRETKLKIDAATTLDEALTAFNSAVWPF